MNAMSGMSKPFVLAMSTSFALSVASIVLVMTLPSSAAPFGLIPGALTLIVWMSIPFLDRSL